MNFRLLILIKFLILTKFGVENVTYNGKYFDVNDRINADCVRVADRPTYDYIGNLNKIPSGEKCVRWDEVMKYWFEKATKEEKELLSLPERVPHSNCRLVKLSLTHKFIKLSTTGTSKLIPSGSQGAWCYIRKPGKVENEEFDYLAEKCFEDCDLTKVDNETEISSSSIKKSENGGYTSIRLNYNIELLDPIQRLFKVYFVEEQEYYDFKLSILERPEYKQLQREIFLSLFLIFVVVIFWIIIYQCLKRKARRLDRKREKLLDELYDTTNVADIKMHLELERESEVQ